MDLKANTSKLKVEITLSTQQITNKDKFRSGVIFCLVR